MNTPAKLKWYKETVSIIPNEEYEIINTPETSELIIHEMSPEKAGEYVCEATNRHGADVTISQVYVMGTYW